MLKDLVQKTRSCRRFKPGIIEKQILMDLVDLARLTGCAKNMQTIRYLLAGDAGLNRQIYDTLAWAGFLKDWPGPVPAERPGAYIIMTHDTQLPNRWIDYDLGIAAQTILLGATELGLGGCIVAAIRKEKLRRVLRLNDRYEIKLVLALGIPKEKIVIDTVGADGDTRYWREPDMTHHVPKRSLETIILEIPAISQTE
ncbi:MAG: nitroreductase family protein [FCB group bacterium]|nr:nitroreductase family protein [FCB group bacterium]